MTAKDKAKELIETFTFNCRKCDNAKLSALLAVDLILNTNDIDPEYFYYEEVYQELEKL